MVKGYGRGRGEGRKKVRGTSNVTSEIHSYALESIFYKFSWQDKLT